MPDDRHKSEIEELMEKSHVERRKLVENPKCPVRLLLAAYPHLKSFGGTMVGNINFTLFHEVSC